MHGPLQMHTLHAHEASLTYTPHTSSRIQFLWAEVPCCPDLSTEQRLHQSYSHSPMPTAQSTGNTQLQIHKLLDYKMTAATTILPFPQGASLSFPPPPSLSTKPFRRNLKGVQLSPSSPFLLTWDEGRNNWMDRAHSTVLS